MKAKMILSSLNEKVSSPMPKKILRYLVIALALVCSVWIIFPALNILLSLLGLIEINSPPGPAPVNDYHAQRQTIVAGCEDLQHQIPAYPRRSILIYFGQQ